MKHDYPITELDRAEDALQYAEAQLTPKQRCELDKILGVLAEKYDIKDCGYSPVLYKSYTFRDKDSLETARLILTSAFKGNIGGFSTGHNGSCLNAHYLTVYFKVPEDVDRAIQNSMGINEPTSTMYLTQADAE